MSYITVQSKITQAGFTGGQVYLELETDNSISPHVLALGRSQSKKVLERHPTRQKIIFLTLRRERIRLQEIPTLRGARMDLTFP